MAIKIIDISAIQIIEVNGTTFKVHLPDLAQGITLQQFYIRVIPPEWIAAAKEELAGGDRKSTLDLRITPRDFNDAVGVLVGIVESIEGFDEPVPKVLRGMNASDFLELVGTLLTLGSLDKDAEKNLPVSSDSVS